MAKIVFRDAFRNFENGNEAIESAAQDTSTHSPRRNRRTPLNFVSQISPNGEHGKDENSSVSEFDPPPYLPPSLEYSNRWRVTETVGNERHVYQVFFKLRLHLFCIEQIEANKGTKNDSAPIEEISVIDIVDRAILNQNTMSLKVMKDQGAVDHRKFVFIDNKDMSDFAFALQSLQHEMMSQEGSGHRVFDSSQRNVLGQWKKNILKDKTMVKRRDPRLMTRIRIWFKTVMTVDRDDNAHEFHRTRAEGAGEEEEVCKGKTGIEDGELFALYVILISAAFLSYTIIVTPFGSPETLQAMKVTVKQAGVPVGYGPLPGIAWDYFSSGQVVQRRWERREEVGEFLARSEDL
ncbi:hypothetical protein GUITHDRAFT_121249 [Guillardia theta CCMP2712]|uniref:Uncharacterized protein n=1 Tax=Guillardia theta (strain CCMP2712) TaxID=905079 RepID=L1I8I5_GUITC|nr:hypothetical protein GUITHDRAFT_121249 [Guillardia theta CCMP2712]EKX32581.1 hypothetical protein GUITHDRAFT_121249 [Guillardia theta CCMP2712]|eukprot:XP_005819561.1 hypothetical protein GUITHDRAFT_121249 [Guillardia theta CCMP2712]